MLKSFEISENEADMIPLFLRTIGIDHKQEPVLRPEGLDIYQWFLCTKGQGEMILNEQRSLIRPGDGFFLEAGMPHSYKGISDDWTVQIMGFGGAIVPKLMICLGMKQSGIYKIREPENFVLSLRRLERKFRKERWKGRSEKLELSEEVYHILLQLSLEIQPEAVSLTSEDNSIVWEVMLYLEQNYSRDISLMELAETAGRTPEYLCSIFRKETGQTIVNALTNLRIAKARILLGRFPEKTSAEIGRMCGFQSPSYFGKVFRRITGMSPGKYRKSI